MDCIFCKIIKGEIPSSKVFENGGPYVDLMGLSPRESKRDERLSNSGRLKGFRFEGKDFSIYPRTLYYDYLYLNALLENEELTKVLFEYDGFTDIEYNPNKSISCQAKSAAMFVSLSRQGLLGKIRNADDFIEFMSKR